jgi:plasmid stabilization system protein ParE
VLAVEITRRALAQVERAALWWAENRPAAPDAIRLDLGEALEVLAQQPGIGARCRARRYSDVRRLYLARTKSYRRPSPAYCPPVIFDDEAHASTRPFTSPQQE